MAEGPCRHGSRSWVAALLLAGCAPTLAGGDKATPADNTDNTDNDGIPDGSDGGAAGDDGAGDTGPAGDTGTAPLSCGLVHDLATVHHTEGDTIAFTVSCTGDAAPLSVLGAGPAATFDPATGAFSWPTDGADGGRHTLTLGAERGGGALPETLALTIWIADDPDAPGATLPTPATYTEEWGLPVVHIEVGRDLSETEQDATITVRGTTVEGRAKVRGASSASYPKNSYTLDFDSDELGVVPEWGERTRGHMVLTSTFDDNSYMRQRLGFELWARMAAHTGEPRLTPRTFFAVVYINRRYHGLYMGCDRIDDEYIRHMGYDGEGNLYKAVSHDANFRLTAASGATKSSLRAGYTKEEGDPEDWSDLEALVAFTGAADADALFAEGDAHLDVAEFADWLLWARYTLAEDSAGKNAYLYRGDDTATFRFSPWDLNAAWGQNWYTARRPATTDNDYHWNNQVFALLQTSATGQALLAERAAALRAPGAPFDPDELVALVDEWEALLLPSIDRDWARWGGEYRRFDRWAGARTSADDWTTPEEERAYLRDWIRARSAHLEAGDW